jgi:hypothetical protein
MRALTKFDISNCSLVAEGGKALAAGLKGNQRLTELNLAGNRLGVLADESAFDMSGIIALADVIPDMGALTSLDISDNGLHAEGTKLLAEALKSNQIMTALNISSNNMTYDGDKDFEDMSGVAALADAMPGMRALSKLVMRQNNIHGAEAGKAFADMLAQNTVVKELDLSSQKAGTYGDALDAAFLKEFAAGISDNGAMTKIDISSNDIRAEGGKALATALKGNQVIMGLNISSNELGINSDYGRDTSGVIAIADAIPDMGAMTRLNISNNQLCGHWKTPDFSGFKALAAAIEQHKLLTLDTVDISEALYVSGQNLGTAGAKTMATFIKGNGALTTFDISKTKLTRGALKAGESGEYDHHYETDMTGMTTLLEVFLIHISLQALSLLPVPSRIWRPYRSSRSAVTAVIASPSPWGPP